MQLITHSTSMWISEGDCSFTVTESESLPPSLLFVPSLTQVKYSDPDTPTSQTSIPTLSFSGNYLIPCSLTYTIVSSNKSDLVPTSTPLTTYVNESLAYANLSTPLNYRNSYTVTLFVANNATVTFPILIEGSASLEESHEESISIEESHEGSASTEESHEESVSKEEPDDESKAAEDPNTPEQKSAESTHQGFSMNTLLPIHQCKTLTHLIMHQSLVLRL